MGSVQCGHFADKGEGVFFKCGRPHFLLQKKSDISKFIMCPHGQLERELSQYRYFAEKREGSIFRYFVQKSFTDGPLLRKSRKLLIFMEVK